MTLMQDVPKLAPRIREFRVAPVIEPQMRIKPPEEELPKREVYVSLDIETNGPVPELYSMLSIGAVSYLPDAAAFSDGAPAYFEGTSFYQKLYPLADAIQHQDTMDWWKGFPAAWGEVMKERRQPIEVMTDFGDWVKMLSQYGRVVPVAWPAGFDYGFVQWYMHQFYGENPLGFACVDIRSYANGLFHTPGYYEKISEGNLYEFFDIKLDDLEPHVAVDDARRQGRLWLALLDYARKQEAHV